MESPPTAWGGCAKPIQYKWSRVRDRLRGEPTGEQIGVRILTPTAPQNVGANMVIDVPWSGNRQWTQAVSGRKGIINRVIGCLTGYR